MHVISDPNNGHAFEREVLAKAAVDVDPDLRHQKIHNFWDGIERVKRCQPVLGWNPQYPGTVLAKCLFLHVAKKLWQGRKDLWLYSAIGTSLDVQWGVDCFFEYRHRVATVDLTVSPFKSDFKANFLLRRVDFVKDRHYFIGDLIARRLMRNWR